MVEKIFVNNSTVTLQISIFIREDNDPISNIDSAFELLPGETKTIMYGDMENVFLNGIIFFTISSGDTYSKVQFITTLGSELDNLLNTNNVLTITEIENDCVLTESNSSNLFLEAVNNAETIQEIQDAIENSGLGLNLTAYNELSQEQREEVATSILNNRPVGGYPNVGSIQVELNTAINQLVNPMNIYVLQGKNGNGSLTNPFGTIEEEIAAVNVGGTVNILEGTYSITTQFNVNKQGITIKGEPGTILLLQTDIIPLLVTADNIKIEGLTITSDIPYQKEFIQIAGANTRISGNTIFGPEQQLPMSNWVVNRAIVPEVNVQNLIIENNVFHSLRTGIYINPNVTGIINENVIYNTKGGLLVDRALIVIDGNSWGTPENEFDIVSLAGTTTGPPYEDLTVLSENNNNAIISDQRNL